MPLVRIALANLPIPASADEAIVLAESAVLAARGADVICFPETYIPGYRGLGFTPPPPDLEYLETAWTRVATAARTARVAVVLGTERVVGTGLRITALVIGSDGQRLGFQDKVQLDPSEEAVYTPGNDRQVFEIPSLRFGVTICHEGWRYPETVRSLVREGAQVVFHPHFHIAEEGQYAPQTFGDPRNTFHEKAMLCRSAENNCFFASVNCASEGSPTTSAVVGPEGTLLAWQPYGKPGLLFAEVDPAEATGLLARRLRS